MDKPELLKWTLEQLKEIVKLSADDHIKLWALRQIAELMDWVE